VHHSNIQAQMKTWLIGTKLTCLWLLGTEQVQPNYWEVSFTTVTYNKHQFTKLQKIAHECTILTSIWREKSYASWIAPLHASDIKYRTSNEHPCFNQSLILHLFSSLVLGPSYQSLEKIFSCQIILHSDDIYQSMSKWDTHMAQSHNL
jgi:hypothetical protein